MRAAVLPPTRHRTIFENHEPAEPSVGPGRVRIRVKAAGINFADLMARQGLYPDAPDLPAVLGYEVSGEVESVGDDVNSVAVGDRVMAGTRFGGYAEQVSVRERDVFAMPAGWSFEE